MAISPYLILVLALIAFAYWRTRARKNREKAQNEAQNIESQGQTADFSVRHAFEERKGQLNVVTDLDLRKRLASMMFRKKSK